MKNFRRLIAVLIAAALAPVALLAQEAATVTGRVTNSQGQPEASVLVRIESLNVGATTGADGNYRLVIPASRIRAGQSVQVAASRQGLGTVTRALTLSPGAELNQNFTMAPVAIILEDVVVTGTAGATERAKLPFTVDKVSAEDLPVPATSAAGAIQGKVAGAQVVSPSGLPGTAPSILLRGPKSINTTGRTQEPLYIVDGVILAGGLQDIDANDIESVEVVKGAAAASLYGARAANGVVQIVTRSGRALGTNTTRYTLRTEYGQSALPDEIDLAERHIYRLDANGQFIDANGTFNYQEEVVKRSNCVPNCQDGQDYRQPGNNGTNSWNTYQVGQWPGQTYDQVDRFFQNGTFGQTTLSVAGNQGNTNYFASFNNMNQEGLVVGQQGFNRNAFRLNLDQGLGNALQVSLRGYYSTSTQDGQGVGGQGGPLFTLTRMPAGVDITAKDEDGQPVLAPDLASENDNPLYELYNREREDERERFLGGLNVKWAPVTWFDFDANLSYDRNTIDRSNYIFAGYKTIRPEPSSNLGNISRQAFFDRAVNASGTATFRRSFGSVNNRTQLRYIFEESSSDDFRAYAENLNYANVPSLDNGLEGRTTQGELTEIKSEGFYAITNFDINDRYIIDGLIRRDGSSLFGANERWQTYYRIAAAWRPTEESWFRVPGVEDLKINYALGTAGGRPNFYAQYELYPLNNGNINSAQATLGNPDLKPEFAVEQEVGLEAFLFGRFNVDVNYAKSVVEDQILLVPLAGVVGFADQWRNAGTLESNTWEVSVEAPVINRNAFTWTTRLQWDRTRQEITELNVPPFQYGIPGISSIEAAFYAREGEALGTFYGRRFATKCSDLPSGVDCSQFRVNDDGYFVFTAGQDWRAGLGPNGQVGGGDDLWGTTAPFTIRNGVVNWGSPIVAQDADGNTDLQRLGNTTPDYNLSFANTFAMGPVSLYAQIDAVQGVEVYNLPRHWAYFENYHGDQDQDPNDPARKPIGYYGSGTSVSTGLYNQLTPNSHFVEDGSFVKLRELSVRYTVGDRLRESLPLLRQSRGLSLSVVGRNLISLDDYSGFDPEVGFSGGSTGSAAIARFDGFNYPNMKTITAAVELSF